MSATVQVGREQFRRRPNRLSARQALGHSVILKLPHNSQQVLWEEPGLLADGPDAQLPWVREFDPHRLISERLTPKNQAPSSGQQNVNDLRREVKKRRREDLLERVRGARQRELTARHLLLHLDEVPKATPEGRAALDEYVDRAGRRSLYGHERRMYRILRRAGGKYLAGR